MRAEFVFEGLDDQLAEIDRVGNPGFQVVGEFESILRAAFLDTQARAHVLTGWMKASGTTESDFDGLTWEGAIYYGVPGDANWAQDPDATYAVFEMARGGDHNFYAGLPAFHDAYVDAIVRHMRG